MFEKESDEKIVSTAGRSGEENSASVEMTRRLKESTEKLNKSIEKLNKTTARYSKILIWLTLILIVVAIFQIIFLKLTDAPEWLWVGAFLVMIIVLILGTRSFLKK